MNRRQGWRNPSRAVVLQLVLSRHLHKVDQPNPRLHDFKDLVGGTVVASDFGQTDESLLKNLSGSSGYSGPPWQSENLRQVVSAVYRSSWCQKLA